MKGSLCLGEETPALRGRNEINERVEKRRRKSWWNLDWWRKLFRSYGWTNLAIVNKSYWHPNHYSREHKIHFFFFKFQMFWREKLEKYTCPRRRWPKADVWFPRLLNHSSGSKRQQWNSATSNICFGQQCNSATSAICTRTQCNSAISNIVLHQVVTSMQQCKMYHLLNQQCNSERSSIHK